MNIKFSFILLSLFLSFYFSTITTSTCRAGDYRLGQLNLPDNNNWFWNATAPNGDVFYWNICGQVSSTYCAFAQGTSVCQQSSNRQYSLGFETSELIFGNFNFFFSFLLISFYFILFKSNKTKEFSYYIFIYLFIQMIRQNKLIIKN